MDADDQRRADALDRYWDAAQRGEPSGERTPEIGDLTDRLIARLRARRATPDLDPARERVWQDLRQQIPAKEPDMDVTLYPPGRGSFPLGTPAANGRPEPSAPRIPWSQAGTDRRLARSLAKAALIALTLGAIYFAFIADRAEHAAGPNRATPTADWPAFRGNPGRTGATTDPGITGAPQVMWTFRARRGFMSPAIADGVVYALSNDGVLHAFDATTGTERWNFAMGIANDSQFVAFPTVASGTVYVGSGDGTLYALDAKTGKMRWRMQTVGSLTTPTAVVDGVVYFGSTDGYLYALAADTGQERWRFATGPISKSGPAVADGTVYVGGDDLTLYAVDAATGKERWRLRIGTKPRAVVVADGTVYATGDGVGVIAVDAATGQERWHFAATSTVSPAISGGVVYLGIGNEVYAFDAATGAVRWRIGLPNRRPWAQGRFRRGSRSTTTRRSTPWRPSRRR